MILSGKSMCELHIDNYMVVNASGITSQDRSRLKVSGSLGGQSQLQCITYSSNFS